MPIPILAALALQAAGAGLSAYSANRANKKNREAMDAAARRVGQFQVNPLGNKLAQAYSESKLAENDLNQYQKQEAQDLLRAQGDVNYNLSNIAPSGFAALGAQSFNESKTQDQLGRLGAKYAPMGMAAKQQTNQLAGEVDKYNYLQEQERKDKEQSLANIDLGRAQAEAANRNQMTQLAIGLGTTMAGTLAGANKDDLNKLFKSGKTTKNFTPTKFTAKNNLPKVDANKLYKNAMKPQYNAGGVMTKKLNPLQAFAAKNLAGGVSDFTEGVEFKSSVPFNNSYYKSVVATPEEEQYNDDSFQFVKKGDRYINKNLLTNPMNVQNSVFANAFNPNMYYKPKGKFNVQLPIGYEQFINDRNAK
jgi:hypothetical protein